MVGKATVRRVSRIRRRKLRSHQPRARRATGAARSVVLQEARALACKRIDIGRARIRMPVAMQIAAAKIIGEEENDIGRALFGGNERQSETGQDKDEQC